MKKRLIIGIFVIGLVVYYTGAYDTLRGWFSGGNEIWINILMVAVIAGALALAISSGSKGKGSGGKS